MSQMTVTTRPLGCVVVALEHGQDAVEVTSRVTGVFVDGVSTLLVDMSRLERLSSDIVAALLRARREAAARGGRVVLRAPNRRSAALVGRSELGRLFEVDTMAGPPSAWRHP